MQNKNIFIDEEKIFKSIAISKNKLHKIERDCNDDIKIIYEEFKNKNSELLKIFNEEEIKITEQYIIDEQNIKDKNATYKKMYLIIEEDYLKNMEKLVLEITEAFKILKKEQVDNFEKVKNEIDNNKINDLDILTKVIDEENSKINEQLKNLENEYNNMVSNNKKVINEKITNLTSNLNLELENAKNTFEQNKIETDKKYSSEIANINNTYIEGKELNDANIKEYNDLEKILKLQLEKNFDDIQIKIDDYKNNLELNSTIKEITDNIINITNKFNNDNKTIANKLITNQNISINNNLIEDNLRKQLILLNNISNEIENKILNNTEFQVYLNKLDEINNEFIKESMQLKQDLILISDKQIEEINASIINLATQEINTKTSELLKNNTEFQVIKEQYISDIDNEMKQLPELELKISEINNYINELNNNYNVNNKESKELKVLIETKRKEALEQAVNISNNFLNATQNKYKINYENLVKNKEDNINILNMEIEKFKNDSKYVELSEKRQTIDNNINEINEYNNMILFYNQKIDDTNKQIIESKKIVTATITENIDKELSQYKEDIDNQKTIIIDELNLNLNELKINKENDTRTYISEINILKESNKTINSTKEENTNKLVELSEKIQDATNKFELVVKNNSDKLDIEEKEERDRLTKELTIVNEELESYDLLTDGLLKDKESYIAQLVVEKNNLNIMSLLLKIQEIDSTLYKINKDKEDRLIKKTSNEKDIDNINNKYFTIRNEVYLSSLQDFEKETSQYKKNEELYKNEIVKAQDTLVNNNNKINELTANVNQIVLLSEGNQNKVIEDAELKLNNKDEEYLNIRNKKLKDTQNIKLEEIDRDYNIKLTSIINDLEKVTSSININDIHIMNDKIASDIEILESKLTDNIISIQELEEKIVLVENKFILDEEDINTENLLNIKTSKELLEQHYKNLEIDILLQYDIDFVNNKISSRYNELDKYTNAKKNIDNKINQLNNKFVNQEEIYTNKEKLLNEEINSLNNKMKYNLEELTNNKNNILENEYKEYLDKLNISYNNRKDELALIYKDAIDIENKLLKEKEENINNIQNFNNELSKLETINKKEMSTTILQLTEEQNLLNLNYTTELKDNNDRLSNLENEKQILVSNKMKELESTIIKEFEKEYEFTFDILKNKKSEDKEIELLNTKNNSIKLTTDIYNDNIVKLSDNYNKAIKEYKNISNIELAKMNELNIIEENKHLLNYNNAKNILENKLNNSNRNTRNNDIETKYNNIHNIQNNIHDAQLKELNKQLDIEKEKKLLELKNTFENEINKYYINYDEELNLLDNQKNEHLKENKIKLENDLINNKISFETNKSNNRNLLISKIEKEKFHALNLLNDITN